MGLRVRKDKCVFMVPSVMNLGHQIDAQGLHQPGNRASHCPMMSERCHSCGKIGHADAVCRSYGQAQGSVRRADRGSGKSSKRQVKTVQADTEEPRSEIDPGWEATVDGAKHRGCSLKVKALQEVPKPQNVSKHKSYLGQLTYYSRFLLNLASAFAP